LTFHIPLCGLFNLLGRLLGVLIVFILTYAPQIIELTGAVVFLIRKALSSAALSHTCELSARPGEVLTKSDAIMVVQWVAERIVGSQHQPESNTF